MTKVLQILALLTFGAILVACGNKKAELELAQQQLWDEMMVIHDEIMPQMGQISNVRRELQAKMAAMDSTTQLEMITSIDAVVAQLEGADVGMMDWMGELEQLPELRENKDHDQIMAYLQEEKEEITKIKTDMLNAIDVGLSKLNELSQMESTEGGQ